MEPGEIWQFFPDADAGFDGPEIGDKFFLVISVRGVIVDMIMDDTIYRGWGINFLKRNAHVLVQSW